MTTSYAIERLRHEESVLKEDIARQIDRVEDSQEAFSKASAEATKQQATLAHMNDALLGLQQGIEDLDAAEQAREAANAPDSPTNIPEHAVPLTPIEPAEGETSE